MTDQELLSLSEEDIKLRLITPAIIEKAGWSKENIRMEFPLTDGRVIILVFCAHWSPTYLLPKLFLLREHYPYCEHQFPCDIIDVRLSDGNPNYCLYQRTQEVG